jgi:hypothetical protein
LTALLATLARARRLLLLLTRLLLSALLLLARPLRIALLLLTGLGLLLLAGTLIRVLALAHFISFRRWLPTPS